VFGCRSDRSVAIYDEACQNAAEQLVESMAKDPDMSKSERIAIMKIESDGEDLVRENLIIALSKRDFNLIGMMQHSEMDEVLNAQGIQIKYDEYYDSNYLARLGKLLAPRTIFVSKIKLITNNENKVELILYGKLLDLELGSMTWADKYHSISESGAVLKQNVVIFIAIVVVSAIGCFLLMLSTGLGLSLIVITVIVNLIVFYLLLFDYVQSLFMG